MEFHTIFFTKKTPNAMTRFFLIVLMAIAANCATAQSFPRVIASTTVKWSSYFGALVPTKTIGNPFLFYFNPDTQVLVIEDVEMQIRCIQVAHAATYGHSEDGLETWNFYTQGSMVVIERQGKFTRVRIYPEFGRETIHFAN
jgi:hypothetical protein